LVLDQHPTVSADVFAEEVSAKWTDSLFLSFKLEINAKSLR
jgi:hypothetical protein